MILQLAKAGTHNDITITVQDLLDCVANFNPADRVPVIKGHDATWDDTQPAQGWVNRVWMDADYLIGDIELSEELQAEYDNGDYKNWSIGINWDEAKHQYYLHHLAFLGAVPPKIKGLEIIQAADKSKNLTIRCADFVVIETEKEPETAEHKDEEQETEDIEDMQLTKEQSDQLKADKEAADKKAEVLEKQNKKLSDQIAKQKADKAKAEVALFADAAAGKMPKDQIDKITKAATDAIAGKTLLFSDNIEDAEGKTEPVAGLITLLTEALKAMPPMAGAGAHQFSDQNRERIKATIIPANKI